jgi:hypothetical protein
VPPRRSAARLLHATSGIRAAGRTRAALGLTALSLAAAVSLSGCLPTEPSDPADPGTGPTTAPSATPSGSAAPSDAPSPSATPAEHPTPVTIPCEAVIGPQTMYDFNPNFGLLANFTPGSGSLGARAVADEGVACRWINQTSGDTIDVSLSRPGPAALASARKRAASGTALSGLGDAAFFQASGGSGTVQVFAGDYWITATSVYFQAPDDATLLLKDAVAAAG